MERGGRGRRRGERILQVRRHPHLVAVVAVHREAEGEREQEGDGRAEDGSERGADGRLLRPCGRRARRLPPPRLRRRLRPEAGGQDARPHEAEPAQDPERPPPGARAARADPAGQERGEDDSRVVRHLVDRQRRRARLLVPFGDDRRRAGGDHALPERIDNAVGEDDHRERPGAAAREDANGEEQTAGDDHGLAPEDVRDDARAGRAEAVDEVEHRADEAQRDGRRAGGREVRADLRQRGVVDLPHRLQEEVGHPQEPQHDPLHAPRLHRALQARRPPTNVARGVRSASRRTMSAIFPGASSPRSGIPRERHWL